jgi:hypothetical protein
LSRKLEDLNGNLRRRGSSKPIRAFDLRGSSSFHGAINLGCPEGCKTFSDDSFFWFITHIRFITENVFEGSILTETACDEKVVISAETVLANERIVERKTIVYETRVDSAVIKVAGEKLKDQLFTRFGFLKPKPEEIQFVSIDKYYEPYTMIGGKYSIDYYRKCIHLVKVDKEVLEVVLLNQRFEPEQSKDSSAKDNNVIRLEGEERLSNEVKASLILDRFGQDVTLEKLPSAPSERNPKKILAQHNVEEIASNADLDFIRAKIVNRPRDISRLVNELFEINERVVIYTPRFRVLYRNAKTGEQKAVEFDGVTAERIQQSKSTSSRDTLSVPPPPPPPT